MVFIAPSPSLARCAAGACPRERGCWYGLLGHGTLAYDGCFRLTAFVTRYGFAVLVTENLAAAELCGPRSWRLLEQRVRRPGVQGQGAPYQGLLSRTAIAGHLPPGQRGPLVPA